KCTGRAAARGSAPGNRPPRRAPAGTLPKGPCRRANRKRAPAERPPAEAAAAPADAAGPSRSGRPRSGRASRPHVLTPRVLPRAHLISSMLVPASGRGPRPAGRRHVSPQPRHQPRPLAQPALLVFFNKPEVQLYRVLRNDRVLLEEVRQRRLRI